MMTLHQVSERTIPVLTRRLRVAYLLTVPGISLPLVAHAQDTVVVVIDADVTQFRHIGLGDPVARVTAGSRMVAVECDPGWCLVQTDSGEGYLLRDFIAGPGESVEEARRLLPLVGIDEWGVVDRSFWRTFVDEGDRIDTCAIMLARDVSFDERRDWPASCNRYRHTWAVRTRTSEIRAILARLEPADRQRALDGKVWVGAPAEAVIAAWGRPRRINYTTTASGRREQWVYGGNYVYVEAGRVTAIQG